MINLWFLLGFTCFGAAWTLFLWFHLVSKESPKRRKLDTSFPVKVALLTTIANFTVIGTTIVAVNNLHFLDQCHTIVPSDYNS